MNTRHDAHGYWLEEAGPVEPRPPLGGDTSADLLVIGGGYTGLWSAWWLTGHAPDARVVLLEANVCGQGPSGRNGGFVTSFFDELAELRRRFGDAGALAVAHASKESVEAIGRWCAERGVDAWHRPAGHLQVSAAPAQDGAWTAAAAACQELGVPAEFAALSAEQVRRRCASPVFRDGALMPTAATVQPARLALGLRAELLERGVEIHEHSRVRRLAGGGSQVVADTGEGSVRAGAAILAVNASAAGIAPFRRRLTVASSHIVLTEPVPEVLEEIGWIGGECITDCRTFLHYFRTTPDGRIAFGWAGGRMGYGGRVGGRIEVDGAVVAQARRDLERIFPALAGRRITHAWGGPIDVSPTHLPTFGSLPGGRVHYAFGYTGNGVGPSHLAGRVLSALALDRRDDSTRLPLVEPPPAKVPPEPLRWVGGELIRAALLRKERAEEAGERPGAMVSFIAGVPRRLGVHIGR